MFHDGARVPRRPLLGTGLARPIDGPARSPYGFRFDDGLGLDDRDGFGPTANDAFRFNDGLVTIATGSTMGLCSATPCWQSARLRLDDRDGFRTTGSTYDAARPTMGLAWAPTDRDGSGRFR